MTIKRIGAGNRMSKAVIHEGKVRAPAGAMELIERVK